MQRIPNQINSAVKIQHDHFVEKIICCDIQILKDFLTSR